MAEKSRAMILGENLKRIREEKGISRKELAEATGITANMIGEYETGKKLPPLDKIFTLANSLEVAVISLTGDNNFNPVYPDNADIDKKVFEYRLQRALNMAERGHYRVKILDDGRVAINTPKRIEHNDDGTIYFTLDTPYTFKDTVTFVEIMEAAERTALFFDVTFNEVIQDLREEYATKLDT